jgi:hypothetical protein
MLKAAPAGGSSHSQPASQPASQPQRATPEHAFIGVFLLHAMTIVTDLVPPPAARCAPGIAKSIIVQKKFKNHCKKVGRITNNPRPSIIDNSVRLTSLFAQKKQNDPNEKSANTGK